MFVIQRLAADFSDVTIYKIKPQTSFDLNHIKNGATKYFENSLESTLLYESPKDSLGKCFVLLSIGTHLMKL